MIECDYCGQPLDGTACRWLCPRCGMKLNCCEGAPLPAQGSEPRTPGPGPAPKADTEGTS